MKGKLNREEKALLKKILDKVVERIGEGKDAFLWIGSSTEDSPSKMIVQVNCPKLFQWYPGVGYGERPEDILTALDEMK